MLDRLLHLVTGSPTFQFLRTVPPFEFLADEPLQRAAEELSIEYHVAGTTLFVQGQSRVEELHLVLKGAVELIDEASGARKALLAAGQHFGGPWILLDGGLAGLTARAVEDTFFYTLPGATFLALCEAHREFRDFFADSLGPSMLGRIGQSVRRRWLSGGPSEEAVPFQRGVDQARLRPPSFCPPESPIRVAAAQLEATGSEVLLVGSPARVLGLVSDAELRSRVLAAGHDPGRPVAEIMSPPPPLLDGAAPLAEAIARLIRHDTRFLAVADAAGQVVGLATERDLPPPLGAPLELIRELGRTRLRRDVAHACARTPGLVRGMLLDGVRVESVAWVISAISDAVVRRMIDLALQELGPAPAPFAFLALGSQGRREQTLQTDQDNALVYADPPDGERGAWQDWFLRLGRTVCAWLNEAGYPLCPGDVMASNPRWCAPLSSWRQAVAGWARTPDPQATLNAAIFLDFRAVHGEPELARALDEHVASVVRQRPGALFYHLASDALRTRPPLGFFGNVLVEVREGHRRVLDIKQPIANISDFARLNALWHGVRAGGTLERLQRLTALGELDARACLDLKQAYSFLTQLRLARQVADRLEGGKGQGNLIEVDEVPPLERRFLEESFKLIALLQERVNRQFLAAGRT